MQVFALLISMPRFKSINFYQERPKFKLFLHQNTKFFSAGGLPPDPVPPAAGSPLPEPQPPKQSSPLQISGNAPDCVYVFFLM